MPRLPINYSNTIIYKICCNDVEVKECYVGSTTDFTNRKRNHKNTCNNENDKNHNLYVYKFIRENNGWNCWNMVMIEEYPCENKLQAETRERYWIETLQSKLNKKLPTRNKKEYEEANKDEIAKKQKIKYELHKKEIAKKTKIKYELHKEEIAEKQKIKYELHKEELAKKYTCMCGSILSISGKSNHNKTKKHLAFLELTENIG